MKRGHFKEWEGLKEASVLGNIQLDELMEEEENSDIWKQAVSFDGWIIILYVQKFSLKFLLF